MKKRGSALLLGLLLCIPTGLTASAAQLVGTGENLLGPTGLTVDADGTLYIADQKNHTIFSLDDTGTFQLTAGVILPDNRYGTPTGGYLDGDATLSLFNQPSDVLYWNDGLVISDTQNHCLRFLSDGQVTTLAGSTESVSGDKDSTIASNARFYLPMGLAADEEGTLYVADSGNGSVRAVTTSGAVSTYADGFDAPCGLAWYDGVLYVTDAGTHEIFTVVDGETTWFAGQKTADEDAWLGGYADGTLDVAAFDMPQGIFVDGSGIYVADTGNAAVRLIADDQVSTLLTRTSEIATWPVAPTDLVVVGDTLYLADPFAGVVISSDINPLSAYTDIPADSWWTQSAYAMIQAGLFQGTSDTTFSPEMTFTREMTATLLYRYQGSPEVTGTAFSDVVADSWYSDGVTWAADAQVVTGAPDGTFGVGNGITRQDFVTILYRYSATLGLDTSAQADLSGYQDSETVSDYATEALSWAVAEGIISGTSADTLTPLGISDRSQACVILDRWLDWMG